MAECNGIDVSKYQGDIDWAKVKKAGIDFAMIRATARDSYIDEKLAENVKGCEDNGIAYGFYHYSYAKTKTEVISECDHFLDVIGDYNPTYPVCFDLEDITQEKLGKELLTEMAVTFLDKLEKAGYYAMLYTNQLWLKTRLDQTRLAKYDIWLATWSSKKPTAFNFGIWQNSVLGSANDVAKKWAVKIGSIDGVETAVDVDISYKDYPAIMKKLGLNKSKKRYNVSAKSNSLTSSEADELLYKLKMMGLEVKKEEE